MLKPSTASTWQVASRNPGSLSLPFRGRFECIPWLSIHGNAKPGAATAPAVFEIDEWFGGWLRSELRDSSNRVAGNRGPFQVAVGRPPALVDHTREGKRG